MLALWACSVAPVYVELELERSDTGIFIVWSPVLSSYFELYYKLTLLLFFFYVLYIRWTASQKEEDVWADWNWGSTGITDMQSWRKSNIPRFFFFFPIFNTNLVWRGEHELKKQFPKSFPKIWSLKCVQIFSDVVCNTWHTLALVTVGYKMHVGWSDHKWTLLNTSVND